MNLENNLAFFINQGPIFWAAAASVGVGGALLITATYVYLRRRIAAASFKISLPKRRSTPVEMAPNAEITVTDTGYAVAGKPAFIETFEPEVDQQLPELLARLRAAGDRLEDALGGQPNTRELHSPLKAQSARVDYESRVGVG